MIEVVPASPAHVGTIAARMQMIDIRECAASGRTPKEALRHGLRNSITSYTVKVNGRPEAMFGVMTTDFIFGEGAPWLLMTDVGARQHRAIVRLGARYLRAMFDHYCLLHNRVHAEHEKAIRWLARLGFVIGPVDVIRGEPMREFSCAILSPLQY